MSKEEIKIMKQKSAELVKQGLSMDKLRSISDNMLNIEGNIESSDEKAFGLGEMLLTNKLFLQLEMNFSLVMNKKLRNDDCRCGKWNK